MGLKEFHTLFGFTRPELTSHFYQRYAQRVFGVDKASSAAWARFNGKKIIADFYKRFNKLELLKDFNKTDYYYKKYGNDLIFLKHNNYIFVVREYRKFITVYKIDN